MSHSASIDAKFRKDFAEKCTSKIPVNTVKPAHEADDHLTPEATPASQVALTVKTDPEREVVETLDMAATLREVEEDKNDGNSDSSTSPAAKSGSDLAQAPSSDVRPTP